jgi:hypothetical protein
MTAEHPILFSGEMVRAILEGRKTQTRRVVKRRIPGPETISDAHAICKDGVGDWIAWFGGNGYWGGHLLVTADAYAEFTLKTYPNGGGFPCPYGKPGDRLWVRETFYQAATGHHGFDGEWVSQWVEDKSLLVYAADHDEVDTRWRSAPVKHCLVKRPSIHMPREFARITLEIVDVRVERLQEISHRDALSEGVKYDVSVPGGAPLARFETLWDSINARRGYGFSVNPWVWVVEFKRLG